MSLLPKFWQRHFLGVEAILAISLGIAFAVWFYEFEGKDTTCAVLQGNRAAVYGAVASIFGSLLGFAITATSIVLSFSTLDKLAVVRESSEYPKLWKTFISTIWALGITTIIALSCLLIDKESKPTSWLLIALVYSLIFSLLRIARTIWALEQIIALVTKPSPKP